MRYSFPKEIYSIRSLFEGGAGIVLEQIRFKKEIIQNKITKLRGGNSNSSSNSNNNDIKKNENVKENISDKNFNQHNKPLEFKIENSIYEGNDEIEIKIDDHHN